MTIPSDQIIIFHHTLFPARRPPSSDSRRCPLSHSNQHRVFPHWIWKGNCTKIYVEQAKSSMELVAFLDFLTPFKERLIFGVLLRTVSRTIPRHEWNMDKHVVGRDGWHMIKCRTWFRKQPILRRQSRVHFWSFISGLALSPDCWLNPNKWAEVQSLFMAVGKTWKFKSLPRYLMELLKFDISALKLERMMETVSSCCSVAYFGLDGFPRFRVS